MVEKMSNIWFYTGPVIAGICVLYWGNEWRKSLKIRNREAEERRRRKLIDQDKPYQDWNLVLFFPDHFPEAEGSPTSKFLNYFKKAKFSIHICAFLVSYKPIIEILLQKRNEGLKVQIITDADTMDPLAHKNDLNYLKERNVEVRYSSFGGLMHHKFAVIDERAVITGSLNWTRQGITTNKENVLSTTDKLYVKSYKEEFDRLWLEFRPKN